MSGGTRIAAVAPGGDQPTATGYTPIEEAQSPLDTQEEWAVDPDEFAPAGREWIAPSLAVAAAAAWTAFFLWTRFAQLADGITPLQGSEVVSSWAAPVLLIGVVWLLIMRTSRREATRFGDAARLLSAESAQLEQRLVTVNRELSLAREFLAAQSRDLDSLGRVATDRISEHADRLQGLVRDNGAQVDAIASVSITALDNMERLRGQLPVIASSAKDVANNIGHAGRTAQTQLDELAAAFVRLGHSGEAGEQQVSSLQQRIDSALGLFEDRLEHLQQLVAARLEELEHRSAELRGRLDGHEEEALASLRARAAALGEEFDRTRDQMESHEAEALTSLRARLNALRDESGALARALRNGEAGAMEALTAAKDRVEAEITAVVERLDRIDRDALEAARTRIAKLSDEAAAFDARLAERDAQFAAETEFRLDKAAERHDAEVARLAALFDQLDQRLSEKLDVQQQHQQRLASDGEAIAARIEALSERIAAIAAFGNEAEESLGDGLRVLSERLAAGRETLAGTDVAVAQLTDGAVRLLELLQASTVQSRDQLPAALAHGDELLVAWERRLSELRGAVDQATGRSEDLARNVSQTRESLVQAHVELTSLHNSLGDSAKGHAASLDELRETLAAVERESIAIADQAQDRLATALDRLAAATVEAVAALGDNTDGAVTAIADRLGNESAAAIDRVMRIRMAEAVGQLEQAAGHAAGISREAAIQMRDQLAKVDELAGNLERRVAHARSRAEEQVDNDFSRRVALITESLNSNAIDIAKALSTDVTDTAWSAYLRGDRGVFTRRAVKLIEVSEAREIARIYENDPEFRDHVSRYIHDFEAMLRQLLSTRDGHALGVTLLSSDMGKLYVVLAQSIERLRA